MGDNINIDAEGDVIVATGNAHASITKTNSIKQVGNIPWGNINWKKHMIVLNDAAPIYCAEYEWVDDETIIATVEGEGKVEIKKSRYVKAMENPGG